VTGISRSHKVSAETQMRSLIIMLVCVTAQLCWFSITSYKMDRGLTLRSSHLAGELTIRTLAGSLSIAHWPLHSGPSKGIEVYPYSYNSTNSWGGGTFFHYRRELSPGNYYSELRLPILTFALPLLLASAYIYSRFRHLKNKSPNKALHPTAGNAPV
jgi:hypothetical protein